MQANYNLDSDDDDEEEEKELDIALAAPPKSNWHLQDIEKVTIKIIFNHAVYL